MLPPFQFKQFSVQQDQCAMKIGTDGVLLGAWTNLDHQPETILDIGAGTGILALIMAQRSTAMCIDAVEIEEKAYIQCVENFENSPWGDRLFCYHADFLDFAAEMDDPYDLIICNPPFFKESSINSTASSARQQARFSTHLPFEKLLKGAVQLLTAQGELALVVPFENETEIIALAEREKLFLQRGTHVRGRAETSLKRSLLQFGFTQKIPIETELVIEHSRHKYTAAYKALTQDFYLKM